METIKILGLDISTSVVGYTILNENNEILECNYLDLSKEKDYYKKVDSFKNLLISIKLMHEIDHIGIEDIMSKFSSGKSSAKTIITLARFNGTASYVARDMFGVDPEHINVLRARKLAIGYNPNKNSLADGEDVKEHIRKIFDKEYNINWPMMIRKPEKHAKQTYDMVDSIVIAKAKLKNLKQK